MTKSFDLHVFIDHRGVPCLTTRVGPTKRSFLTELTNDQYNLIKALSRLAELAPERPKRDV